MEIIRTQLIFNRNIDAHGNRELIAIAIQFNIKSMKTIQNQVKPIEHHWSSMEAPMLPETENLLQPQYKSIGINTNQHKIN